MSYPSAGEVHVAVEALRSEADQWDTQGGRLEGLSGKVAEMEFNRVEAGLFQVMVAPYNEVIQALSSRCTEGSAAMTEIGNTLRTAANTYEAEDQAGEHRLRKIY